jgi:asparagine synthase (glutamine-hydrolysing)
MCGITGFVTRTPTELPAQVIRQMTDQIHHRGPDDCGYYRDAFASLGHRRLSIVDLATGKQPMFNERRNLCIIFNGEIFNHADLRPDLERKGHVYVSRSDTETILHAYEQYGTGCLEHLRGMFAFAIWDSENRTLFCARDRLGIKPFYYYWDGHLFAFASEIKALLRHPSISPRFDRSMLPEYLALGYSCSDRTLFGGIRKLLPGHNLLLTPNGMEVEQYWERSRSPNSSDGDEAGWIAECRKRLEETVQMRLMSDVPLGMFLSGGVDSSAIASLMARMVSEPVKTFSVGYRETAFSELGHAAHVARTIGTDHHELVIGREEFFRALPKLIWHEDEPIVWPASVPLYFVSKLAAKHVKVVLSGEGADELFGGYARYRFFIENEQWMRRYASVPANIRDWFRERLEQSDLLPASLRRKLQHTLLGREPNFESFYLDNFYAAFDAKEQHRLLATEDTTDPYSSIRRYADAAGAATPLERLLYTDQKTYLVELLMKQDQMSMAASIESRVPFLDHLFVEFAARVPDHLKIRNGEGKYILKRAVADLLPHDIIHRTKMGFPTPLRQWLADASSGEVHAILRDPAGLIADCVDLAGLETLLERHARGRIDATDRIWRLMNLQLWGKIFLSGQLQESPLFADEDRVEMHD